MPKKLDNGVLRDMTPAEIAEWEAEQESGAPPVPQEITMGQARLQLFDAGLLPLVPPAIAALPDGIRERAEIEWEYRPNVRRDSDLVEMMRGPLSLTPAQMDQLFIDAAKL